METLEYDKLTIYEVNALRDNLLEIVKSISDNLILDIASVEKIDMPAIQLLLSIQKSCKEKGFYLTLIGVKPSVEENLKVCACDSLIGGTS